MYAESLKELYPVKRHVTEERVIREKVKGGLYHIPQNVQSPEMGFATIMGIMNLEQEAQEVFGVLAMNTKYKVIGFDIIHRGDLNSSIIHPREIFKALLLRSAASFICFHNHPSGDPAPSREDIEVTHRLEEVGKLMGIQLMDHIITGDEGRFTSLKEKGHIA